MKAFLLALLCAALVPCVAQAAGFAYSDNFVIYSPKQGTRNEQRQFAKEVLIEAEKTRKEIATKWLGEDLPNGTGRSAIYITFSATEDSGLTWAKDHPDRVFHNVYLTTSPELAVGSTLRHEIVHTTLATSFPAPNRLPPWCEEGIATRFDDSDRKSIREQLTLYWLRSGTTPHLASILNLASMSAFDETSYAASASLVDFLLTKGDEQTLLEFAADGQRDGWERALSSNYGIATIRQLQGEWESWLTRRLGST